MNARVKGMFNELNDVRVFMDDTYSRIVDLKHYKDEYLAELETEEVDGMEEQIDCMVELTHQLEDYIHHLEHNIVLSIGKDVDLSVK